MRQSFFEKVIARRLGVSTHMLDRLAKSVATGRLITGAVWVGCMNRGLCDTEGVINDAGREVVRRARSMGY